MTLEKKSKCLQKTEREIGQTTDKFMITKDYMDMPVQKKEELKDTAKRYYKIRAKNFCFKSHRYTIYFHILK